MRLTSAWCRVELQKALITVLVHLHDGGLVAASIAVIGSAKDGDHILLVAPVVAVHDELVGPADEAEAILMVKLLRNVLAKGEPGAPWTDAPATALVRVAPKQVAHGSLVGHLLHAVQLSDVVEGVDGGAEAAVQAKDVVLHQRSEGKEVE
eukprot:CAMPEP_0198288508 /NCGR_PEP_ID=MMETSP1449-20131203/6979_1 /TAXON_ID=420275 /ORGANISM="Attheya septentrionalis, Strain CCMP2084" /LENGTH=150 /DNA_ID=CAMNT_0043986657 /DNA_START=41 /DNA_END=493 /DNA_ORIENTATION=+